MPRNKQPIARTRNIADEIARDLRQQIINGQSQAGDRLPAERELAQTLGLHRGSVDAIDAWESDLDGQERSTQPEPTDPESRASVR
ncbi:MAG: GntR family transcriptional regulator [Deltaproteobacteria bacterium]|nr:MAG: GntR family transcriptional regulator [Deltaproteobacteria bacterium]TDJ16367.1 MAG: GntR family transcriptional regulator [Deltaproteobacteria bacterium]